MKPCILVFSDVSEELDVSILRVCVGHLPKRLCLTIGKVSFSKKNVHHYHYLNLESRGSYLSCLQFVVPLSPGINTDGRRVLRR